MSVAPNAGIVDLDNFLPPTSGSDGLQGQVPKPLAGQQDYVLTASGWVPLSSLGTLIYQGTWDASTNTPTLTSSVGTNGYYYVVSVAGNTNLNGITTWTVGDWALFNGSVWQKIEGGSTVDITGGQINNTLIGNLVPAAGTFTTLTATGQADLGGPSSNPVFRVNALSSAIQYIDIFGSTTGTTLLRSWSTNGSSSGLNFQTRGSVGFSFQTGGSTLDQLRVSHTASAVNYVQVTGAATGGRPTISAQGSDSAVGLNIFGKAGGSMIFSCNGTVTALQLNNTTSGVNYLQMAGAVAGSGPVLSTAGSDTNISQVFQSKGTGAIDLAAGSRGVNISNGGTVTALTRTVAGTGYTSPPTVAISAPTTAGGVQATASAFLQLATTPTITSGGTGYTVNDVLTFVGGTIGSGATASAVTVTAVSGGVITGISINQFGTGYSTVPTNPISVTGGTGTGATFTVSGWQVSTFTITNAGSGYVEQPTVTFSGGGGSGAAAYATVGSDTTIKSTGTNLFLSHPNGVGLQVRDNGQTACYPLFQSSGTTIQTYASSSGSNVGFQWATKGTSAHAFATNASVANIQMQVAHTASAVNYVQVTGAVTGSGPKVIAQGSDTNINLDLQTKGTGYVNLLNNRTNYFQFYGGNTGQSPTIYAWGSDTNIDLTLTPKGTGAVRNVTGGGEQLRVANTASAVNYVQVTGATTANGPRIDAVGSDAAIGMYISTKGGGGMRLQSGNGSATHLRVEGGGSGVNYLQVAGVAGGSGPVLSAQGSDTNIDIVFTPKGTGLVQFGTYTAGATAATGYISIKDSTGTTYKILVST